VRIVQVQDSTCAWPSQPDVLAQQILISLAGPLLLLVVESANK